MAGCKKRSLSLFINILGFLDCRTFYFHAALLCDMSWSTPCEQQSKQSFLWSPEIICGGTSHWFIKGSVTSNQNAHNTMPKASSPVVTQGGIRSWAWNKGEVKIHVRCHFNEKSVTSSTFPERSLTFQSTHSTLRRYSSGHSKRGIFTLRGSALDTGLGSSFQVRIILILVI